MKEFELCLLRFAYTHYVIWDVSLLLFYLHIFSVLIFLQMLFFCLHLHSAVLIVVRCMLFGLSYNIFTVGLSIFAAMSTLTASICWNILAHRSDEVSEMGVKIYQKPESNEIYELRRRRHPPLCPENENPDAAW